MLVPVGAGDGLLGDMRLLGIVLLVAVWFRDLCHTGWRLCSLRSHGCVMADQEWIVEKRIEGKEDEGGGRGNLIFQGRPFLDQAAR